MYIPRLTYRSVPRDGDGLAQARPSRFPSARARSGADPLPARAPGRSRALPKAFQGPAVRGRT